ncbi:MAG: MoaD/ThiS family protein [Planctomycetota bacterium]|jgi:molybdopterin converting factor small subunit
MNVTVEYTAQIKRAAGTARESLDVADGATVADVLRIAAEQHDDSFRRLVLTADSTPQPTLLIFVADEQVRAESAEPLTDGATVTLLAPISGG